MRWIPTTWWGWLFIPIAWPIKLIGAIVLTFALTPELIQDPFSRAGVSSLRREIAHNLLREWWGN